MYRFEQNEVGLIDGDSDGIAVGSDDGAVESVGDSLGTSLGADDIDGEDEYGYCRHGRRQAVSFQREPPSGVRVLRRTSPVSKNGIRASLEILRINGKSQVYFAGLYKPYSDAAKY